MGSRFPHSNNPGRACCGIWPVPRFGAPCCTLQCTENYRVVNPNGLTETFFTFGELFLQQVRVGQCQVVCTGGTSLKAQQLVGKRHANKLWRNDTRLRLGERANHGHPQKDMAGGLTHTYLTSMNRKQAGDFFSSPPLNIYLDCF